MSEGHLGSTNPGGTPSKVSPRLSFARAFGKASKIACENPMLVMAVFIIKLPLTYALSQIPANDRLKYAMAGTYYEWIVSGFVTFGVYRCALTVARAGSSVSLGGVFKQGASCWGMNFRLFFLLGLSATAILLVVILSLALVNGLIGELTAGSRGPVAYSIMAALVIVGFAWTLRMLLRISLSSAWLADYYHGSRTSAMRALVESWYMTKDAGVKPLCWAFLASLLFFGAQLLLAYGAYMAVSEGIEGYVTYETAAWVDILLSIPEAFISVLVTCMFAMLYLQYSQLGNSKAR